MKIDFKTFLLWMRNGIAFAFTWLMIVLLVGNFLQGIESISTTGLLKLLAFVCGGVLLFTFFFSDTVLRGVGFTAKLTWFMVLFSAYESVCFYWMGVFSGKGSLTQWIFFWGIILVMYGISMFGYELYSRKKAVEYNYALHDYQEMRGKR